MHCNVFFEYRITRKQIAQNCFVSKAVSPRFDSIFKSSITLNHMLSHADRIRTLSQRIHATNTSWIIKKRRHRLRCII